MDLNELQTADDHEEGAKLFLVDRSGKEVDAYVIVRGPDSKAYRTSKRKQKRKILELLEAGTDLDDYDFYPMDVAFVSAIISGWGEITQNGEPYAFSEENCKALLDKAPQIVERVLEFCGNRENFIKG